MRRTSRPRSYQIGKTRMDTMDTNYTVPHQGAAHTGIDHPVDRNQSAANTGKARVLIVDDVSENRDILRRRFERNGFHTTQAAGGLEALDLIGREAFDLVLLDMMMPEIGGLEVLNRIRSEYSPGVLPVIMVTAKSQSEDIVEALGHGANDYVTKPVDFSIALARVITQIDRKRAGQAMPCSSTWPPACRMFSGKVTRSGALVATSSRSFSAAMSNKPWRLLHA